MYKVWLELSHTHLFLQMIYGGFCVAVAEWTGTAETVLPTMLETCYSLALYEMVC